MKTFFYILLTIGSVAAISPSKAGATGGTALPDNPIEARHSGSAARAKAVAATKAVTMHRAAAHKTGKVAAKLHRAMLVVLGLEGRSTAMSPARRDWQLHQHQKHLRNKAMQASQANRRRLQRH